MSSGLVTRLKATRVGKRRKGTRPTGHMRAGSGTIGRVVVLIWAKKPAEVGFNLGLNRSK